MTVYLTERQIEKINSLAIQRYSPNEKIQTVSPSALNMIVNLPEQFVFGKPLYPTIFDKATILFVQLIKKHVFANANKRTAERLSSYTKWISEHSFRTNGKS